MSETAQRESLATADPVDYVEVHDEPAAAAPAESARDHRGINRMAPELVPTHRQLVCWAKIANADNGGTGWKRRNALGRLQDEGMVGFGQFGVQVVDLSEDDQATDAAVSHLGDIDRRVIWAYYVDWHKARQGQWWRLTGMKEKQAAIILNRARWRLNGWLACHFANKM